LIVGIIQSDLLDPSKGFLTDDMIPIRCMLITPQVESSTHVPYVGLRNQGATCYMNAMLNHYFICLLSEPLCRESQRLVKKFNKGQFLSMYSGYSVKSSAVG
jgi:ubiquitin C-terminal hydrolase